MPSSFALQWAKVGRQSLPTPSVTKYNKHWTFMFNYSLSNWSKKLDDGLVFNEPHWPSFNSTTNPSSP